MTSCIYCGCSDLEACPEGCSWSRTLPGACTVCVLELQVGLEPHTGCDGRRDARRFLEEHYGRILA